MRHVVRLAISSIFLLLLFHNSPVYGKVYIDIDSPSFQKFPIAITEFKSLRPGAETGDFPVWFADTLSRNLLITGYFNVIDRRAFLEDPSRAGITGEGTRFADWTTIGAEYLIKGGFQADGRQLIAEFRLFDVMKGELIVGKRYTGTTDDKNRIVLQFANEVLQALTGEAGLFDTRIAFVKKNISAADLYTSNFDGSDLRRITSYNSLTLAPRWSPDGRQLAFTSYKDGKPDIYLRDLVTEKTEKITSYPGLNLPGSWSRDGTRLLVTLSRDGNQEIYDMTVGNRLLQRLTREFSIDVSPVRSPDEKRIAFVSNRNGSPQIYIMDADGGNVRRLTFEGNYNTSPAWSPKGKMIAYEGSIDGRFQIFVINEEGGAPQQLTFAGGDHESPAWSPDGRYLAYSVRGYGRSRIEIMNSNGQNSRVLHEGNDGCLSPFWSPHLR
ncbi:MAG: Tol-Pal system beta propeller repeat protein TolB [Syntrophus sp. (in: bacteria)]|nr:Tol-Pal system beta propeller repeat protein TolB [Syntrophus sp. (in: bacteria)]